MVILNFLHNEMLKRIFHLMIFHFMPVGGKITFCSHEKFPVTAVFLGGLSTLSHATETVRLDKSSHVHSARERDCVQEDGSEMGSQGRW